MMMKTFVVWFEQQQQPPQQQHQQLMPGGGGECGTEMEPGRDASHTPYESGVIAPSVPTAVLPRRGRRQAVYDPKVCRIHTLNT